MLPVTEHSRRWFRFSLGAILLLIAMVAVSLGLATTNIRARKAMREWIEANEGMIVTSADSPKYFDPPPRTVEISIVRSWFGDEAIAYVWMPQKATDADWSNARPLFPEALWMDEISYDWVGNGQARRKEKAFNWVDASDRFLTVLTTKNEQDAYNESAKRAGVTVSEWARENLNKAARRVRHE